MHWVIGLAALGIAGPACATTYYVSPGGSDLVGVSANSMVAPFHTLQKAASVLRDGDAIVMGAGVYTEGVTIQGARNVTVDAAGPTVLDGSGAGSDDGMRIGSSGVMVKNTTFRNWRGRGVFAAFAPGLTVEDCVSTNNGKQGYLVVNSPDVTFLRCTGSNSSEQHGIYVSQSSDRAKIIGCTLTGNGRCGLQINAEEPSINSGDPNHDQISNNCLVAGNTILDNGKTNQGAAMNLLMVQNSTIVNNLIAGNHTGGIALWDEGAGATYGAKNNTIIQNTVIFNNGEGRYAISVPANCTGNKIFNNILVCGRGSAIDAAVPVQSDYNILKAPTTTTAGSLSAWQRATGDDQHSFEGDPRLDGNYMPLTNSPAIDMGTDVYDTDKNGTLRPQGPNPDCGCYEMAGSSPPPPTVPAPPTSVATAPGDGSVTVSWNGSTGATGYNVFQSTTQTGGYQKQNSIPLTGLSFTATGLTNGALYWFKVRAVNSQGESADSTAVSGSPNGSGQSTGDPVVIYDDTLANGWRVFRTVGATANLAVVNPVQQGTRSMGIVTTGPTNYVRLAGAAFPTTGKSSVKLAVNYGTAPGQEVRLVAFVNGRQQTVSVVLSSLASTSLGNGWFEYSVPLTALGAANTGLTGLRFTGNAGLRGVYLDNIRLQ